MSHLGLAKHCHCEIHCRTMNFVQKWLGVDDPVNYEKPSEMQEALLSFIGSKVQENMTLEYKESRSLGDPKDIRKAISSFANSEGGLLVVGVSEDKDHLPLQLDWISDPKWTKERFQDSTINLIEPYIPGVNIITISDKGGRIFLVDVPSSPSPPHMCDYTYYFRNNYESLHMEHGQIADFFGKRRRPIIVPNVSIIDYDWKSYQMAISFTLINEGLAIGKWPFFRITIESCVRFDQIPPIPPSSQLVPPNPEVDNYSGTYIISSPIEAVHSKIKKGVGHALVQMRDTYSLAQMTVGAEEASTDLYVGLFSTHWISDRSPQMKREGLTLPIFKAEPNTNLTTTIEWFKKHHTYLIQKEDTSLASDVIFNFMNLLQRPVSKGEVQAVLNEIRGRRIV